MKKLLALSMVALLGFLPVPVFAQQEPDTVETTNTTVEETIQNSETVQNTDGLGPDNRSARLQNYKERLVERLSNAEQRRIQGACKGAQAVVLKLNENVAQVKQVRENAYSTISQKLTDLVAKLELAGVEASQLEEAVTSMNAEVQIFLATMTEYQTILADLGEVDCISDPEAFKAALEVAKQQRVTLVSSSQGLRQYFNDGIKPILQNLRSQLIVNEEGEES